MKSVTFVAVHSLFEIDFLQKIYKRTFSTVKIFGKFTSRIPVKRKSSNCGKDSNFVKSILKGFFAGGETVANINSSMMSHALISISKGKR